MAVGCRRNIEDGDKRQKKEFVLEYVNENLVHVVVWCA
jgi:hypothetical protein